MTDPLDTPRLPGYVTYLQQWVRPHFKRAIVWSAAAHLVAFAAVAAWLRFSGTEIQPRRLTLREWQTTPQLFLQNIPVILEGGGGGPGSMESPPGPGQGGAAVKVAPLAIPVPVPDDEVSNPEATIATQEEAKFAGIVTDEKADTSGGGGGGGGGGSGGGYGGGTGTGIGEGEGFGQGAFQTPPIPMRIVFPPLPKSLGKKTMRVLFLILVDDKGIVVEDRVFESSGFASLDSLAAEAVRESRFIPAKQKGKAISAWTRYEVKFGQNR